MKKAIIILAIIAIVGLGAYFVYTTLPEATPGQDTVTNAPELNRQKTEDNKNSRQTVIGKSVEGRDIVAYHYGSGSKELLFVGGIHGGYEWNTVLVAKELADYLEQNPSMIPAGLKVTIIPVLNPDGLNKVVGVATPDFTSNDVSSSQSVAISGRFNANNVDLSRNFDCNWQSSAMWQSKKISGGSAAFSEPESMALKNYVEANDPAAVVGWYSAAGGVYASSCNNSISPETSAIVNAYAKASGYPAYNRFTAYKVTGDMLDWVAKNNIPAMSVLLTDHTNTEWDKNLAGVKALFTYFSQ